MKRQYTPEDIEALRRSIRFRPRAIQVVLLAIAVLFAGVGLSNLWLAHVWSRIADFTFATALQALLRPTDPQGMYRGAQVLMVERLALAVSQLVLFALLLVGAIVIPRRIARDQRIYRSLADLELQSPAVGNSSQARGA